MTSSPLPAGLQRIRWMARCVRVMCVIGLAIMALLPVAFWHDAAWVQRVARDEWLSGAAPMQLDAASRLLGFAAGLPVQLLTMVALWQLWRLFGCYGRGEVFTLGAIRHLQRLGQSVILMAPAMPLCHTLAVLALTWGNPPGQRVLVFSLSTQHYLALLFGLVLLAMGLVMQEARRMAQENAEFI